MIWSKEETMSRSEIEAIQLERLQQTVAYIYEKVKPYKDKMDAVGIKPEDIKSLDDLKKLPFTNKSDFRDNYPTGLFAVDKHDLV
ncbi:MAG: phenylacetate--CoA ligase, partial [Lachnospiraceae bacterium]|nr:phenylacetate--CoA ligase [Lachnospiraceae bacterium]